MANGAPRGINGRARNRGAARCARASADDVQIRRSALSNAPRKLVQLYPDGIPAAAPWFEAAGDALIRVKAGPGLRYQQPAPDRWTCRQRTRMKTSTAERTSGHFSSEDLWTGVDRLIERAPTLADLQAHRLHLLASRLWLRQRRTVPDDLSAEEMAWAFRVAAVQEVLRTARGAYDGHIVILKGPHTAQFYPSAHLRPYADLDLLVDSPDQAQQALIAVGFVPVGPPDAYFYGLHHLRPLGSPGLDSLVVEIHRRPNWLPWADPPSTSGLLATSVPDVANVPGIFGLPPEQHAVLSAVHSWVELPLRRLSDLVDVSAVMVHAHEPQAGAIAREWGVERLWNTTLAASESLFFNQRSPQAMRIWARNLEQARDRTVLETHLRRAFGTFWARSPVHATLTTGQILARAVLPAPSDTWSSKATRTRIALGNLSRPAEEHSRDIGPGEHRAPRFKRRP